MGTGKVGGKVGEYEDQIQALRDEGLDEVADRFDRFSNQEMRKRVGNVAQVEKERDELKAKVELLEAAPKRSKALADAGVDLKALSENPAAMEIIENQRADEYNEDWAKGLVEKYRLPVVQGSEEEGEPPAAADFGKPSGPLGTGGGQGTVAKSTLTPAIVAGWGPRTRMRFAAWCDDKKSDALERLSMGETVTGVTFDPGAGKA